MKGENFRNKALVGGLVLAVAGTGLPGCSSPSKTMKGTGAGMRLVGEAAGKSALSAVGGYVSVAGYLLAITEIGNTKSKDLGVPKRPSNAFVEKREDFRYDPNSNLIVPRLMRNESNWKLNFDNSDDVLVGVNTYGLEGKTLVIEISRKAPFSEASVWTGNSYKVIRKHKHVVTPGEDHYIWDPFEDGHRMAPGDYFMMATWKNGFSKDSIGVDHWEIEK
jgi:hypothetical protein